MLLFLLDEPPSVWQYTIRRAAKVEKNTGSDWILLLLNQVVEAAVMTDAICHVDGQIPQYILVESTPTSKKVQ